MQMYHQKRIEDSDSSSESGSCGSPANEILCAKRVTHESSLFSLNIVNPVAAV